MLLRFFEGLARVVSRRPVVVLLLVLVVTGLLGGMASQSVTEQDVAVDNELTAAQDELDARFADRSSVVQVLIESDDGDVRSAAALRTSLRLRSAIEDDPVAVTLLVDGAQPPIAGFLDGAAQAVRAGDFDPAELTDDEVRELQARSLDQLPPEVAGLVEGLLGEGEPPTAGLVLVFQDTTGLDDQAALDQQRALVEVLRDVEPEPGVSVEPFAFGLLLDDPDIGPEIGRLFGTALLVILLVLAVVYRVRARRGQRGRIARRTAADVGLTLAVIVLSVVWMQGLGVLLGPDYAGLIGYFSPQTQIVPILIVGLGVDFAIHLLARYRSEVGGGAAPEQAWATSARTVGLTLLLCTAATAIGFLTNLVSPVEFLATLGVLAAAGIVAAFVLTLTVVPAVRVLLDRRAQRRGVLPVEALGTQNERALPRVIGRTAVLAERVPVPTLVVALLLAGVGGYGFTQLDSEFELTDFVPQDEPLLATFEAIDRQFNGGFDETTALLLTGDLATPDGHDATIESIERAGEIDEVATVGDRPDGTTLASVLVQALADESLAGELAELGVRDDLRVEDDADVAALYARLLEEVPAAREVLAPTDDGWVGRVELRTTAGQSRAAELEASLLEAFAPVDEAGGEAVATSPQIVQADIGERIEDSQLISLLTALAAAMALLVLHFTLASRRPLLGVITVLPVGLVLALTFGTMALTGVPLNPVTATLAALSIGIGVPFMIHVTSRFLEERERGAGALRRTVTNTGGALAGSALTTAIGFGVLITSTLLPFEQLGYVIVYAIVTSLIAAVLVLPSLLALWDRWDRRREPDDDSLSASPGDRRTADAARPGTAVGPGSR
jgi:uncharacterized protein